jgi:hypothetical protein
VKEKGEVVFKNEVGRICIKAVSTSFNPVVIITVRIINLDMSNTHGMDHTL